jgi:chemotaxis protein MotB
VNSKHTYKDNNWLSSARAINVATYLMDSKGLNPKTLSWTGRGEYDPVASNATPEGRAKNRRVEIKIHNKINN